MKEFIYLNIRGETASFKVPQIYQGFLLSLPVPPYSTILGMLSSICGREIKPRDTKIGYIYTYQGVAKDLETYHRWIRRDSGTYGYNKTAVRSREIHYKPHLRLILDNLDLWDELKSPERYITLGRSQDLCTIYEFKKVRGEKVSRGNVHHTLIKYEDIGNLLVPGLLYNIPEYYQYEKEKVRRGIATLQYLALFDNQEELELPNLYNVNGDTFYLYRWHEE